MQQIIDSWDTQINWSDNLAAIKKQDVDTIKTMLQGAIQQYGEKVVLNNIKKNSKQISDILERALYGGKYKSSKTAL